MSKVIRTLFADDHQLVLDGLSSLVDSEPDIKVVTTVSDGKALLEALEAHTIDVIVMDLQMPYKNGLDALAEIKRRGINARVLILTAFGDPETMQRAIERGAEGFALKTESPEQVVEAIRMVAGGRLVYPRSAQRILGALGMSQAESTTTLSRRELEVLKLAAQGLTNAQIAHDLTISENTVRFHLKNIFEKLHVNNRTEATVWYMHNHIMNSFPYGEE